MEDAVDALKIAFAVIVFVMALTISITMFSALNDTSKVVLASSDTTNYYSYYNVDEQKSRIVGLETIIPTLYKYYKENYTVLFLDKNGNPLDLYESQTDINLWGSSKEPAVGIIGKYYTTNKNAYSTLDNKPVCSFDVDEETARHEPWTGSTLDFKKNLDAFLNGTTFAYPSGGQDKEGRTGYEYSKNGGGFIKKYGKSKFKELLGEYIYNVSSEGIADYNSTLLKNKKKRVIIYQLQ